MSASGKLVSSLRRIAIIVAGVYLLACVYLCSQQKKFIFFPDRQLGATPNAYGVSFEDVRIPVRDKNTTGQVDAWWIPAADPAGKVLLYFHGNGSNISGNVERAVRFNHYGLSVLLVDYRGYGQSSEILPSESSVYADAEAAWRYVLEQRHVDPRKVVIYGHSLGGAVAVDLATRHPEAAALITESTFASTYDLARRDRLFRLFPLRLVITQRFDSMAKVRTLRMPYLLIHGTGDRVVPYQMSEQLYAAAPQPKRLVLVPRADHDDCAEVAPKEYGAAMRAFLR